IILAWPGLANWRTIPLQWLLIFLMLGPIAILAQLCNINAFRRVDASVVGAIRYAWILYGAVFGSLFFDEPFTLAMGVGTSLVLRSEEHSSELQSRENLVCRLLLEKKKKEKA